MRRVEYFDAVKGFAILSIMWGHIVNFEPFNHFGETYVRTWTSSFKLAVFYIVAGALLQYAHKLDKETLKVFAGKLFKALMIPYIVFSIGLLIFWPIFDYFNGVEDILSVIRSLVWGTVTLSGTSTIWFLPTLFFGEILFYLIMKKIGKPGYVLFFLLIPAAYFFYNWVFSYKEVMGDDFLFIKFPALTISRSLIACAFVAIGYFGWKLVEKIPRPWVEAVIGVVCLVIVTIFCSNNHHVDFSMMKLGDYPVLFFVIGIVGSFGIILLLKFLNRYYSMTFLAWCGRKSLILMATHAAFRLILIPDLIIDIFFDIHNVYGYYYYSVLAMLIMVGIELPIIWFFDRTAVGRKMIGK